jgi:DNA topoisomerase-3
MLMKTQWRYECACGFKIWHTVAKVELSEEVMKELLTTGKTKQKIAGFTSKAGNTFDTCLKYENDQISFDFDNPGEAPPEEAAAAEETTALEKTEESERKTISNHEN